jgi:GNAT superfamily N-acetyltransferase
MEPYLKAAQLSDIEVLMGFMRNYYEFDQIPLDEAAAYKALEQLLQGDPLGRAWLIYGDDKPVGYVVLTLGFSLEYHGRDAFIDEIYIGEAYRGRGIGTKIFTLVEAEARALGVQALHLEVERNNHKARSFYGKIGFKDNDRLLLSKRISHGAVQ